MLLFCRASVCDLGWFNQEWLEIHIPTSVVGTHFIGQIFRAAPVYVHSAVPGQPSHPGQSDMEIIFSRGVNNCEYRAFISLRQLQYQIRQIYLTRMLTVESH